jgi:hypothetical protein
MIKDTFTFSKNSWHIRLMKWIWDYDHRNFRNMCPYFWLTVFNVIFFVPIAAFKIFVAILRFVGYLLDKVYTPFERYCEKREYDWIEKMSQQIKNEAESGLSLDEYYDKLYLKKSSSRFYKLYSKLPWEIREKIDEDKQHKEYLKRVESREQQQFRSINHKSREQKIGELTVYIKKVVWILGVALAGAVLWLLGKFVMWTFTWPWSKIGDFSLKVLMCVGVFLIGAGVAFLLSKLVSFLWCRLGKYCIPCESRRSKFGAFFTAIGRGIVNFFCSIGRGTVFIVELIIAIKKENCPGLEWKD